MTSHASRYRADGLWSAPDTPAQTPRILIVGAGPTGLGAAYRLRELGYANFLVVEREHDVGGLARSITDSAGFTWDIGGHVLFSHYEYYDRLFERLVGDQYTLNNREAWIRVLSCWVPYPFQNNIRYLPPQAAFECLMGLIRAQAAGGPERALERARNFGEFIDAVFGPGIARLFMRPYNWKVWACPPEMLSHRWIGERVAVVDVERAVRNVVLQLDDFGWGPNNRFRFPLGGTGDFYRRFQPLLRDHLHLGRLLLAIDPARRIARFADGSQEPYDVLISTMPLDVLCTQVLLGPVPDAVRDAASRLRHSGAHIVGVGIRRPCPSTRSWMYFPEDNCPFYRVTYLSNYSPRMTPDPARFYSLLCEISHSDLKPVDASRIVQDTIEGLIACGLISCQEQTDIVDIWTWHAPYAYPTPTVDRDEILGQVIPWLESVGIYSRGRFGLWKYEVSNTDHSLMQGVELVDRLLLGRPERTIGITYAVTPDGRPTVIHTRPVQAGSGEKRLSPASRTS